jgi:hypothetical protein
MTWELHQSYVFGLFNEESTVRFRFPSPGIACPMGPDVNILLYEGSWRRVDVEKQNNGQEKKALR